jgi:hypothetical protein
MMFVKCESSHLTDFAVISSFAPPEEPEDTGDSHIVVVPYSPPNSGRSIIVSSSSQSDVLFLEVVSVVLPIMFLLSTVAIMIEVTKIRNERRRRKQYAVSFSKMVRMPNPVSEILRLEEVGLEDSFKTSKEGVGEMRTPLLASAELLGKLEHRLREESKGGGDYEGDEPLLEPLDFVDCFSGHHLRPVDESSFMRTSSLLGAQRAYQPPFSLIPPPPPPPVNGNLFNLPPPKPPTPVCVCIVSVGGLACD